MALAVSPDTNIIDPLNSYIGTLSPNASFLGTFVNVTEFTTVTLTAIASVPPATLAIQFQWSTDGVNIDATTDFGSDASTTQTVHSTVRAKFFRVRYTTGASGAINIRLQTLLRKGTISGGVSRIGLITGTPDAQIVNAVQFGKNQLGNFVAVQSTNDPYLIVSPPPLRTTVFQIVTVASLSSVQIDFAGLGAPTRRWMSIHNNTTVGSLHIRLGSAATLTNYNYKIPPQGRWELPWAWPIYGGAGGTVFGIWDVADGEARMTEGA